MHCTERFYKHIFTNSSLLATREAGVMVLPQLQIVNYDLGQGTRAGLQQAPGGSIMLEQILAKAACRCFIPLHLM